MLVMMSRGTISKVILHGAPEVLEHVVDVIGDPSTATSESLPLWFPSLSPSHALFRRGEPLQITLPDPHAPH